MTKFSGRVTKKKRLFASALLIILSILISTGCGPSEAEIEALVSTAVQSRLDEIPTATAYPTNTAYPTFTPAHTATPYPTHTPQRTATKYPTLTAYPTNTAYPTYTPFPTATKTTVITLEPTKSVTPYPTYTALPTATAYPTYTPFATRESETVILIVTATKDTDILKADKKDGFYLVGVDIATGTWRIPDDESYTKCYWKLTDQSNQIVRNYIGPAGGAFTIDDSILQLEIRSCGTLEFVGE